MSEEATDNPRTQVVVHRGNCAVRDVPPTSMRPESVGVSRTCRIAAA